MKTDYNFYYFKVKKKNDLEVKKKLKMAFSLNEILDTLQFIFKNLNDLKPKELCKLINLLVKIEYSNFENWKKIFIHYQMLLSLITPTYQHVPILDIGKIFTSLQAIYNFLPFTADKEMQSLLDISIKKSLEQLLQKFNDIDSRMLGSTFNSMSRLGLLDDQLLMKIENDLIRLTKEDLLRDEDFIAIVFAIFKSNCASQNLFSVLEKKCEILLDFYSQRPLAVDPVNVKMIIKGFYYASRYDTKKSKIFIIVENLYINYPDSFPIHEAIELAFCLSKITELSPNFYRKLNENLEKSDIKNLTEYLASFLIKVLLSHNSQEFSHEIIVKYTNLYKKMALEDQLKLKDAKHFKKLLQLQIENEFLTLETRNFLSHTLEEIKNYLITFEDFKQNIHHSFNKV
jgi:hypothetical protein